MTSLNSVTSDQDIKQRKLLRADSQVVSDASEIEDTYYKAWNCAMIVWVVSQGFFLFGFDSTSLVDLQIYIIESYPDMTMFQR